MYKLTGFVLFLPFLQMIPAATTKTGTSSNSTTCQSTMTSLIESLQDCATALDPVTAAKKCSSCFSTCCNSSNNDILAKLNVTSSQLDTLISAVDKKIDTLLDACTTKPVPVPLPTSCQEIKTKWPNSHSGYYHIGHKTESQPSYVYCHMEELCSSGGGWTRIAYLDMSDYSANCPPGFKLYQSGSVRACGRQSSSNGGCQSVKFSSYGNYSQVCGRVVGYQYASPDALDQTRGTGLTSHNDINSHYVDGISLTRGSHRQHIWTFITGYSENVQKSNVNCPCTDGTTQTVQSFIGSDYFCESGNPVAQWQAKLYTADPLWDGNGCESLEQTCCQAPGLPWFHKVLNSTTTDYLEMRVCADQETDDEDVPVNYYEIYIK